MLIPLAGKKAEGRCVIIDDDDYGLVCDRSWSVAETAVWGPYAQHGVRSCSSVYMHKLITGYAITDHINGNGLDNRRSNLREATVQLNGRNRKPDRGCSSSFKGVYRNKNAWMARIQVQPGKRMYLGIFRDEIDAARAYDSAAREWFGEWAWLNFPDPERDS